MVLLGCTWILLLLPPLIIILVNENSYAKSFLSSSSSKCQPNFNSSCGSLPNISYPFRLKHDPKGCGLKQYELACENNRPILYLLAGKYYVLDINYKNETIRVVDVGIDQHNCSSLPLHSLPLANLPSEYPIFFVDFLTVVMLVNCQRPIKSGDYSYVDLAAGSNSNCFNNYSFSRRNHSYMLVGHDLTMSKVTESCTVKAVVPVADEPFLGGRNLSLLDFHNAMANGFELYYIYGPCPKEWSHFHCLMEGIRMLTIEFFFYETLVWCGYLGVRALIGLPLYLALLVYKFRRRHAWMNEDIESFLQSQDDLVPISYSYSMINKMTTGFNHKLGEGGFAEVYKGKLRSGKIVAVKMLKMSKATAREFINEVATIGKIHHVNVVRLVGFHAGRSKRALIYDFMPNGSLEKYIFFEQGDSSLTYNQMFKISLGVARGIEYLHCGCEMKILHFDIKPHNILLDEDFTPKVSDFGLAKLYPTDDSIVSLTAARGTFDYMAPELLYKNIGGVSHKADVYSFGMLLMEMAGRRRNLNAFVDHCSQVYFPSWVYNQLNKGKGIEIGDANEEDELLVKKMMLVALWCIQMKPDDRPSMSKVVEMLQGSVTLLPMPSKPSVCPQEMGDE
ncbi:rust resistance kinase Lr10-like [Diospyros lotus]|uniref:rust resistance kinase Lr10-like n=1 Tax=Diospyros lotus TaxID=55363 RepID=UPI002253B511|nr:rust resistance kinase Lr10-like [Diospyros lotus]